MHNFPRFNEYWGDNELLIAGGFFQLFFSHSSTAPFDIETWEYNDPLPTTGNRNIGYYEPPRRVWGYDVALQFAQQHPVSARFVEVKQPRSEFYRELPVDDPYIKLLRCAPNPAGGQIDPTADNC
ncbi:MAG: hypothetical protein AAFW75_06135 [Cyanobacteria bacterium J06636_16]